LIVARGKFSANVLETTIDGRENALEIEEEYIAKYEKQKGRKPRGNL
jgi:hypothetical protein